MKTPVGRSPESKPCLLALLALACALSSPAASAQEPGLQLKVDKTLRPSPLRPDRDATKFVEANSPAYKLVKAFQWTNDDQNLVAKYIAEDKMDAEDAAKKWVEANQDKVDAWLG